MTDEQRKNRADIIDRRWKQLYELDKETGQTALQQLFLINSGGAATTLAFIGAIGATKIASGVKISLAFFIIGVILVGVSRAKQFHHMSNLFRNWKKLVEDYYSGANTWEEIINLDNRLAKEDFWDYAIPYASFACFIIGSIMGFIALW